MDRLEQDKALQKDVGKAARQQAAQEKKEAVANRKWLRLQRADARQARFGCCHTTADRTGRIGHIGCIRLIGGGFAQVAAATLTTSFPPHL